MNKTIISLIIGVLVTGILINILSLFAYEENLFRFLLPLKEKVYPVIGGTIWEFSYFFTLPFSFLGFFLGIRALNSSQRKLAIFAIFLNLFNFIFALFIAWLLFGLARGM